MDEGSPARPFVIAAFLGVLVIAAVWSLLYWRDAARNRATPLDPAVEVVEPSPVDGPTAQPVEEPEPGPADGTEGQPNADSSDAGPEAEEPADPDAPDPESDADEPPGPATGDYAAFSTAAELKHPDTDPDIHMWYDHFGYHVDDSSEMGQWTNKDELWDSLAPGFRAEALTLGPPYEQPLWDNDRGFAASINVRWNDDDTLGRGELVEFGAVYVGEEGPTERNWVALISTETDGSGQVVAVSDGFDLPEGEYATYMDQRTEAGELAWDWVLEQDVP